LGFVLVAICLLLIALGLITVFYNAFYKMKEKNVDQDLSNFKPTVGTERGS
jgi:ABC-type Fe3+ transport system permease subunit